MIDDITGVILAGGRSSRFGTDKALSAWKEGTLLQAAVANLLAVLPEVMVVSKNQFRPAFGPRVRLLRDLRGESHPLVGLYSGLSVCPTPWAFVCACDMPLIRPELVSLLASRRADVEAVVPFWKGKAQPLCALYSRSCLPVLESVLGLQGSMTDFIERLRVRILPDDEAVKADPGGDSFRDIDDPAAYQEALEWAS